MLRALLLALALLLPSLALAQPKPATLVADQLQILPDETLVAIGNVEVFYNGARLRASKITFHRATGRLTIVGPIILTDTRGTIFLADQGELAEDLSDGILTSARMVLDQQLQIAADEITRVSGRYTKLNRVVASSCQVCANRPVPLWEIRASSVVHDQLERQLDFRHAQFRVAGVPVFYLPRLRMPDPTVERMSGFLVPDARTTSKLGLGLKLPYFIAINDHKDLTLTPYMTTKSSRTLEARYRQAFATGTLEFDTAITKDRVLPGETRGYVFAKGAFVLPRKFLLDLQIQTVSDPAYLLDYGYSDADRLVSAVAISRTRRNEHIEARLAYNRSLRAADINTQMPSLVSDLTFHRRFSPKLLGGEGGFRFDTHSHRRESDTDGDAGRDVARATLRVDWRRNWVTDQGLVFGAMTELTADYYKISQDVAYPGTVTRFAPVAAVELRWPLVRTEKSGATQVLEPIVQLVWAKDSLPDVPNTDSRLLEFDEGNLFALSRFPGTDRQELGVRANVGVSWNRIDLAGWTLGVTAGRIFRAEDLGQFSTGSGLSGKRSDWLLAAHLTTANGLHISNRALIDDDFGITRDELRLIWQDEKIALGASYLWMDMDLAEDRPDDTSEFLFDAKWQFADNWGASFDTRYDFIEGRAAKAGLGLSYRNECVEVDLSLSRRFTSSISVQPTTDISLAVALSGFGSKPDGRQYRRSCGR